MGEVSSAPFGTSAPLRGQRWFVLLFLETVVPLAREAPSAAAALVLRPNARTAGVGPILQPDGRPLPTCKVALPLDASGEDVLSRWAADAVASSWPAGRTIRAELVDGAGSSIKSMVLGPAVFGVEPLQPAPAAAPAADPPRPALHVNPADSASLIGAFFDAMLAKDATIERLATAHAVTGRTAIEASARVAAAQSSHLGSLAGTVARAHSDQAATAAAATAEARAATAEAGEARAEAVGAQVALELAREGAALVGGGGRGTAQLDMAAKVLSMLVGSAGAPRAAAPTTRTAPPVTVDAPAEAPAEAAAPPPHARLTALVQLANSGDPDAQAMLRAAIAESGGLASLAWLAPVDG